MRTSVAILFVAALALFIAAPAFADWQPGDGHKMHFPQLPDELGWDVAADNGNWVADDWQCSETGPVTDIHFWGSWRDDIVGINLQFTIQIWSDVPDPDGPGPLYSHPGILLWEGFFEDPSTVPIDPPTLEGWYNPATAQVLPDNHGSYFQYNVRRIPDPFIQQQGTIYWLVINCQHSLAPNSWGWKNSQDHWNDDAVWTPNIIVPVWQELFEPPGFTQSMDMAFVITKTDIPTLSEWGLIALLLVILAAGGMLLVRRRRATA